MTDNGDVTRLPLAARVGLSLTRRLPPVRGSGRVASAVMRRVVPLLPRRVATSVAGVTMDLDPTEYLEMWFLFAPQLYDHREIELLREHLRLGDTFVDVGAHIGFYTFQLAQKVGTSGRVLAIEADPESHDRLAEASARALMSQVTTVQAGVLDRAGQVPLHRNVTGNRGGHSFRESVRSDQQVIVRCAPLLAILEESHVRSVQAMKLDIEGLEERVLRQFFADAPRRLWPDLIVIEHHPELVDDMGIPWSSSARAGIGSAPAMTTTTC